MGKIEGEGGEAEAEGREKETKRPNQCYCQGKKGKEEEKERPKKKSVSSQDQKKSPRDQVSFHLSLPSMSNKRRTPTPSWQVQLDDPTPLRSIVDSVANVVHRATFKITQANKQSPFFLKVDTADAGYTSCISVRYQLDQVILSGPDEEIKFCVDCRFLAPCLSNIRPEHTLTLEGHEDQGNPTVVLRTRDPDGPSHETNTELNTFVDTDEVHMFPMDHNIMLEIDLLMFRNFLKQAQSAKAEHVVIRIYVKESAGKSISYTSFSVQGENFKHEASFCHEVTRDDDGSMVVRAATDSAHALFDHCELDPIYEGIFPVEKVAGFIKTLQCRMLVAKVKQGMPIMFTHCIGGTTDDVSHIRFLLAAINPDT